MFIILNGALILIDGAPTWMAVTGEGTLDRIDISHLERIEVLRGPASVVYGSNAYSGAINLVLRQASTSKDAKLQGDVQMRFGALSQAFTTSASVSHATDTTATVIAAEASDAP